MNNTTEEIDIERISLSLEEALELYGQENITVHAFDIKEKLLEIRDVDEELYLKKLHRLPNDLMADVISELPSYLQEEAAERLGIRKLARITSEMDTDDAADFLQSIRDKDSSKAEGVLGEINDEDQKIIRSLISYEDGVAGSYMQTELFSVRLSEVVGDSINRLRQMKDKGEVDSLSKVFILKENGEFVCTIGLEELILLPPAQEFGQAMESNDLSQMEITSNHLDDIKDVIDKVSDYNLSVLPVVDNDHMLVGRITSDDIYDLIETQATDEMFGMAGLNAEVEQADDIRQAAKQRALWLGVNLITAIAASAVIAIFDTTIQSYVALAILMPIVASMGGNAGTQSLTVTVRQLSIGEIDLDDSIDTIKKEISLSLINGFIFAVIIGFASYYWFKIPNLGIVIALSTIINLFIAGFSGAIIPLLLDRMKIDPAIASTVLLTTITDIIGFFSFLGLAKIILGA